MKAEVKITLGSEEKNNSHPYTLKKTFYGSDLRNSDNTFFVGYINRRRDEASVFNNNSQNTCDIGISKNETDDQIAIRIHELRKLMGYE
jgi:hypothetical protein